MKLQFLYQWSPSWRWFGEQCHLFRLLFGLRLCLLLYQADGIFLQLFDRIRQLVLDNLLRADQLPEINFRYIIAHLFDRQTNSIRWR